MELLLNEYELLDRRISQSLKSNGIEERAKTNTGLWLGTLVGLTAVVTILREDSSYSEICLLTGVTGFGLIISSICLYLRLATEKVVVKDFQAIYFLPAIVTSMSFLLIANKGLLVSVVWGLCVGSLGTWGVLQLMSTFPSCFTLGEATAVMHACVLFLMSALTNLPLRYHLPPIHNEDIATVLLQVGILYVISVYLLCGYFPLLHSWKYFYPMTIGLLIGMVLPLLYILLDQCPLTWGLHFIFSSNSKLLLIVYWVACLSLGVIALFHQIVADFQATTVGRKWFHLLAVLVYIPGLIYEPTLLYLASGVVMGLFMMLELMRIIRVPPIGETLQRGFAVYADTKDVLISLTPLYLLGGLSFPLWMPTSNLPLLPLLSGVLTIGIGDTVASFVGSKWGVRKWPGTDRSYEGTFACILSQVALILALASTGLVHGGWLLLRGILASIVVSFVEARTNQIDNLALPLLMYVCLTV